MFQRQKTPARIAPPREHREALPSPSKIPRSRTMNVISSIKSTFSSSKIQEEGIEQNVELQGPYKSIQTSFSRADLRKDAMLSHESSSSPFQEIANEYYSPSANSLESFPPYGEELFPGRQRSSSPNLAVPKGGNDPSRVRTAMPDQYWSGRFVGLHDRFRNELHEEHLEIISQLTTDMYPTLFHEGSAAVNSDYEEHRRAKRVFIRLELTCITQEAKESLWIWQQKYARKVDNQALLPRSGTMNDRDNIRTMVFGKTASSRQSSAPFPSRNTSFGMAAGGGKRKMSSLGNEVPVVDEEDTLLNHRGFREFVRRVSSTRLPTPTFATSKRSDKPITDQTPLPIHQGIKNKNGFGFGRKTSAGFINIPTSNDQNQGRRRGTSIGMSRETTVETLPKPKPPFSMSRDISIPNLSRTTRPPPYHSRPSLGPTNNNALVMSKDRSISNISRSEAQQPSYHSRPSLAPSNDNALVMSKDRSISNISRSEAQRGRPSLPRTETVGSLSAYSDTSSRYGIPRDGSVSNNIAHVNYMETKRKQFALPSDISIQSLASGSLPSHAYMNSAPRSAYNSIKRTPETQCQQDQSYTFAPLPRDSSVHSGFSGVSGASGVSRLFSQKGIRPHPRVSNGSTNSGSGKSGSIPEEEEYGALDDDIDVWHPRPTRKPKPRPSNLGMDFDLEVEDTSQSHIEREIDNDELGSPQWDERGYPFYYFDGKKHRVPSKASYTVPIAEDTVRQFGGGIRVREKRVITEDRADTWQRLLGKREARIEKDRRMVEEGREIEKRYSGLGLGAGDEASGVFEDSVSFG